jgi:predicted membrane metal-binding protein
MKRTILLYALGLGVAAFLLAWLEYKYVARVFSPEVYILLIAAAFTALGVWAGHKLTTKPAPASFRQNALTASAAKR